MMTMPQHLEERGTGGYREKAEKGNATVQVCWNIILKNVKL